MGPWCSLVSIVALGKPFFTEVSASQYPEGHKETPGKETRKGERFKKSHRPRFKQHVTAWETDASMCLKLRVAPCNKQCKSVQVKQSVSSGFTNSKKDDEWDIYNTKRTYQRHLEYNISSPFRIDTEFTVLVSYGRAFGLFTFHIPSKNNTRSPCKYSSKAMAYWPLCFVMIC